MANPWTGIPRPFCPSRVFPVPTRAFTVVLHSARNGEVANSWQHSNLQLNVRGKCEISTNTITAILGHYPFKDFDGFVDDPDNDLFQSKFASNQSFWLKVPRLKVSANCDNLAKKLSWKWAKNGNEVWKNLGIMNE